MIDHNCFLKHDSFIDELQYFVHPRHCPQESHTNNFSQQRYYTQQCKLYTNQSLMQDGEVEAVPNRISLVILIQALIVHCTM